MSWERRNSASRRLGTGAETQTLPWVSMHLTHTHTHTHTHTLLFRFSGGLCLIHQNPPNFLPAQHEIQGLLSRCPGRPAKKQHFSTIEEAALVAYSLNSPSHLQLWLRVTHVSVCRQETKLSQTQAAEVLIPALEGFSR